MVILTQEPIDATSLLAQACQPAAGAVLLFLGITRELTGGRRTITLDYEAYGEMAQRMVALAEQQDGCIGVETTADRSGFGITVGYFRDEAAVLAWKNNEKHLAAQKSI